MSDRRTGQPIDPRVAGEVLRRYYATTPARQVIDDLRRVSPELAERLGVGGRPRAVRGGVRRWFAGVGRSIHRLFS